MEPQHVFFALCWYYSLPDNVRCNTIAYVQTRPEVDGAPNGLVVCTAAGTAIPVTNVET